MDTQTDGHFASIISPAWYILHSIAMLEKLQIKVLHTFCSAERGFLPHCSCVYCGELVIDMAKISLGLRSIEHL